MAIPYGRVSTRGSSQNPINIRAISEDLAEKITKVGTITYSAVAEPGTPFTTAKWKVRKVDATDSNNIIVTWSNGRAAFENVATDLTALSYS